MHEMSLTESIVEIAVEAASREGASRVRRVFVDVGGAQPRRARCAPVLFRRRLGRDDRRRRGAGDPSHPGSRMVHGLRQNRAARRAVRAMPRVRALSCPDDCRGRDAGAGDRGRLTGALRRTPKVLQERQRRLPRRNCGAPIWAAWSPARCRHACPAGTRFATPARIKVWGHGLLDARGGEQIARLASLGLRRLLQRL